MTKRQTPGQRKDELALLQRRNEELTAKQATQAETVKFLNTESANLLVQVEILEQQLSALQAKHTKLNAFALEVLEAAEARVAAEKALDVHEMVSKKLQENKETKE